MLTLIEPKPIIGQKFERYAREWKSSRPPSSSAEKLAMHPAYQKIIGLGPEAIPFILRELESAPALWFWALRSISGENPVAPQHRGNIAQMADDWVKWARNLGYEW